MFLPGAAVETLAAMRVKMSGSIFMEGGSSNASTTPSAATTFCSAALSSASTYVSCGKYLRKPPSDTSFRKPGSAGGAGCCTRTRYCSTRPTTCFLPPERRARCPVFAATISNDLVAARTWSWRPLSSCSCAGRLESGLDSADITTRRLSSSEAVGRIVVRQQTWVLAHLRVD